MMTQIDMTRREARLRVASDEAIPAIPEAPRTAQGWYTDPAVPMQVRWWDGVAWSDHVRPAPGTPIVAQTDAVPQFDPGPESPAPSSLMGARTAFVPIAAPLEWNTRHVWTLAFSPLLSVGVQLAGGALALAGTGQWPGIGLSIGWIVIVVASVGRDRRELVSRGYPSPASIFWILLTPLAYLIVRTVKLRRAVGRGSAPLWWYLGSVGMTIALALGLAVALVIAGVAGGSGAPGVNSVTSGPQSTSEISGLLQADVVAQGYPTTAVICPETADQSPGATFQCSLMDASKPAMPGSATVVMEQDGLHFSVTYTFPDRGV